MDWVRHKEIFSPARMNLYLIACNQQSHVALNLYKYNIQASQALYPILSIFEVSLRNALDHALSEFFDDKNWLISQRTNFAYHPLMVQKDSFGKLCPDLYFGNKLKNAESWLRDGKKPVTHARLLAKMTFGFWIKFFNANSIKVFKGTPLNALTNKPAKSATAIYNHLKLIRSIRNKIAHHEAICFNKDGNICLETMIDYENKIVEALDWLGTDLTAYADKLNYFKLIYNRISTIYHSLPHASSSA